ncbi:inhibitor of apoptosis-promoting Bax1 protein (macronuclear) [Tetrahymena thermophila SB210]|uniref:Inhibitor of apoptosis-promoting Bax1 protein n=1 Tax=Tetrahymena thermophila (strain SB210) TaxID=312017 RepID=Q22ZB7_TETTS|nr:inhibitor of apoptosis-promoting Bax1 protein [Tetrahymena thermophila SB210]EAR90404.1 inhibitor of apoptosis-promoting Bax1 protein [Tetrahymena thermophila SB210]|eukprot:XP_001010649.1 inhibitor of apoptosis-promoting Bax1 protein [Tetrahymena thermophila SB210]
MIENKEVKDIELLVQNKHINNQIDLESQKSNEEQSQAGMDKETAFDSASQKSEMEYSSHAKQSAIVIGNINNQYQQFEDVVEENNPQTVIEQTALEKDQIIEGSSLLDSAQRNFVKKVFCIVFFQLLVTSIFSALSMYVIHFQSFQVEYYALLFVALGLIIITQISVFASRNAARKVPLNYILLLLFTISWAYLVSFLCGGFSINQDGTYNERNQTIIFLSVIVTFSIVLSLTFLAHATSIDFQFKGTVCSVLGAALAIISVLICIGFPFIYITYSLLSGITFGFYLVFDLHAIMDGKYEDISLDDYIIASMLIYVDIIMLFLRTLEVLSRILPRD